MASAATLALTAPSIGAAGGPVPFGVNAEIGIGVRFCLHGANLSRQTLHLGAAPIAEILFGASPALAAILLPVKIYHQLQLIVCSSVAKRYATRLTVSTRVAPTRDFIEASQGATP